jgi:hypothetical protein
LPESQVLFVEGFLALEIPFAALVTYLCIPFFLPPVYLAIEQNDHFANKKNPLIPK